MVGQYVTAWPLLLEKLYVAHVPVCARSSGILPPTRARLLTHTPKPGHPLNSTRLPLSQPYRAVVTHLTVHCPQSLTTIRACLFALARATTWLARYKWAFEMDGGDEGDEENHLEALEATGCVTFSVAICFSLPSSTSVCLHLLPSVSICFSLPLSAPLRLHLRLSAYICCPHIPSPSPSHLLLSAFVFRRPPTFATLFFPLFLSASNAALAPSKL